jgi:Ca2+-binding EF-hand superfamily protein
MNMAKKITLMAVVAGLMASTAVAAPDGNGAKREPITRADRIEQAAARFDAADKDGDGFLNAEEARSAAKDRHAKKGGKKVDREPREGGKEREGKSGKRAFEPISRASVLKKAGERFDQADKDGDGVLSREEARAAKKAWGGKMKDRREVHADK